MGNVVSDVVDELVGGSSGHCQGVIGWEEERRRIEAEKARMEVEEARRQLEAQEAREKEDLMEQKLKIVENTSKMMEKYETLLEEKEKNVLETQIKFEDAYITGGRLLNELEDGHTKMMKEMEEEFFAVISKKDKEMQEINEHISSIENACKEEIKNIYENKMKLLDELFEAYTKALIEQEGKWVRTMSELVTVKTLQDRSLTNSEIGCGTRQEDVEENIID